MCLESSYQCTAEQPSRPINLVFGWSSCCFNILSAIVLEHLKLQSQMVECLRSKWLPQIGWCTSRGRHHFLLNPAQYLITQSNLSVVWMPSISVRVIKRSRTLGKHRNEDTAARWWDCFNSQSVSYGFDPQLKGSQPHRADKLRSTGRGQAWDDSICFKLQKYMPTTTSATPKCGRQLNKFTGGMLLRCHKLNHFMAA